MLAPELNFIAATFARAEVEREVAIVEETSMIQLSQQFGGGADEDGGGGGTGDGEEDEDRLACEGWLLPPLANASKQFRVGEHRRRHHELEALTNDLPAILAHIIRSSSSSTNDVIGGGEEVDGCVSPPVLSHSWKDMYRASKDIADEAYVTSKGLKAEDLASCRGAFFDPVLIEHGGGSGGTSGSTLPSSTTTTTLPPWVPPHTFFSDSAPHTKIFKLGDEKKWFSSSSGIVGEGAPRDVLAELEALLYQDDHLESLEKEQLIYGNNGGSKVGYSEAKQSTIGPVRGRNVRQESPGTAALLATAKHASPTHPNKSSLKKFFSKSGGVRSSSKAGVTAVTKKASSLSGDGNVEEDDGEGEEEEDHQAVPLGIRSELYKATRRWECLFLIWSKWVVQQVLQFQPPSSNPAASSSTTTEGVGEEAALNAAVKEAIHSIDIVSFIKGYFNSIVHERVFHVLSAIVRPEASLSSIRPGSSFTATTTTTTTTTFDGAAAASSLKMVSSSSGRRYTSPPPPAAATSTTTTTSSKPTANETTTTTMSSPSSPTTSKPFGVPPNKGIVIVKGKQRSIRTLTSIEARIVHEEDSWLLSAGYDTTFLHTGSIAASDRSDAVDLLRSNSSTKWRALGDEESGSGSASSPSCHRGIIVMQSYIRRRLATRRYQSILLSAGGGSSSSAGGGGFTRLTTASRRLGATVLKHFNKQQSLQRAYVQSCIDVARDTALCEKFYDSEEDVFKRQFKQYMAKATDHYLNSVPLDVDWTVEKTSVPATVPSSSDATGGGGGSESSHRVEIRYVNLRSGRSQTENPNMLKVAALKQRELARVTRRREEVYKDMGLFVQKLNVRKVDLEKLERDMGSAI